MFRGLKGALTVYLVLGVVLSGSVMAAAPTDDPYLATTEVLPAPLLPTSATISPGRASRLTFSRTGGPPS